MIRPFSSPAIRLRAGLQTVGGFPLEPAPALNSEAGLPASPSNYRCAGVDASVGPGSGKPLWSIFPSGLRSSRFLHLTVPGPYV
jgi:hypothetical protein